MSTFPSTAFFHKLREALAEAAGRFAHLGVFDTTFAVRVTAPPGGEDQLIILAFDTHLCTDIREAPPHEVPPDVDFVLEAPQSVWLEMLDSDDQTINSLTHFDHPMRVWSRDPTGHDKLFRYSESVQLVFDLARAV